MGKRTRAAGNKAQPAADTKEPTRSGETVWLRADYHAHQFHYRMPETVAIASVSPLLPSPLTVKMALVAALARVGDVVSARRLIEYLPHLSGFYLVPPEGVVTFKAFMRYVRPPADPTSQDSNTGGFYAVSPHIREYALWHGTLAVLICAPVEIAETLERALWDITYLGAKDSQVTCTGVETLIEKPNTLIETLAVRLVDSGNLGAANGPIFRYADFNSEARPTLETLIPFSREKRDYQDGFYMLPGDLHGSGRAKIYRRARPENSRKRAEEPRPEPMNEDRSLEE